MNIEPVLMTGIDGVDLLPVMAKTNDVSVQDTPSPGPRGGNAWLTAVRFGLGMMLLCGLAYPALVTWIGSTAFPYQARGSVIVRNGQPIGSALVAQPFSGPDYLAPRPSTSGYDPVSLAGSNLAPSSPELRQQVRARMAAVSRREGVSPSAVPADLVYASGSSIDPDISPAAALLQVPRIARARNLPEATVRQLVKAHIRSPTFGILGQARVNVLKTNLALDALGRR